MQIREGMSHSQLSQEATGKPAHPNADRHLSPNTDIPVPVAVTQGTHKSLPPSLPESPTSSAPGSSPGSQPQLSIPAHPHMLGGHPPPCQRWLQRELGASQGPEPTGRKRRVRDLSEKQQAKQGSGWVSAKQEVRATNRGALASEMPPRALYSKPQTPGSSSDSPLKGKPRM